MGKELAQVDKISSIAKAVVPENLVSISKHKRHAEYQGSWMISENTIGSKIGVTAASAAVAAGTGVMMAMVDLGQAGIVTGVLLAITFTLSSLGLVFGGIPVLLEMSSSRGNLSGIRNERLQAVPDDRLKEAHEIETKSYHTRYSTRYYDESSYWKAIKKPSLLSMIDPRRFFKPVVLSQYVERDLEHDKHTLVTYKGTFYRINREEETFLGDRAVFRRTLKQQRKLERANR